MNFRGQKLRRYANQKHFTNHTRETCGLNSVQSQIEGGRTIETPPNRFGNFRVKRISAKA
jgi:hypothetical protein